MNFEVTPGSAIERMQIPGQQLSMPEGWAAYQLPLHLPVRQEHQRASLMSALWDLTGRVCEAATAPPTVWLLMDNLHKDKAVLNLSRNARAWKPSYGLGLWPDQPPPRMTTRDDILNMEWGAAPRLPYHTVVQLGATGSDLKSAWTTMFGLGSTVLTFCPGAGERMLDATRQYLKQPIADESFQAFPFYFPLLGRKALENATAQELDGWLGPVQLYLRESEEDNAILLLTRSSPESLQEALQQTEFATANR